MTIYYYRKGVMVGMKVGKIDDEFQPPKNCVEEKVLDEVSYNAHLKHYCEEQERLKDEFRSDLIIEYNMTKYSNVNKIFDKAWELGKSNPEEVEYYFQDLVDFFKDTSTECIPYN